MGGRVDLDFVGSTTCFCRLVDERETFINSDFYPMFLKCSRWEGELILYYMFLQRGRWEGDVTFINSDYYPMFLKCSRWEGELIFYYMVLQLGRWEGDVKIGDLWKSQQLLVSYSNLKGFYY